MFNLDSAGRKIAAGTPSMNIRISLTLLQCVLFQVATFAKVTCKWSHLWRKMVELDR